MNSIILLACSRLKDSEFTLSLKVAGTMAVVFGIFVFATARLAWYDSPAFLSVFFEANTTDGKTYRVPPAFFRSASYQASHGRFYVPAGGEHFPFTLWGSFQSYEDLRAARKCQIPARSLTNSEWFGPVERVKEYVRTNHRDVTARLDRGTGTFNYYLYPHHHYPAPFYDIEFYQLDKRSIVSYTYVLESVCLHLEDGRLRRHVLVRTEFPIPLESHCHDSR